MDGELIIMGVGKMGDGELSITVINKNSIPAMSDEYLFVCFYVESSIIAVTCMRMDCFLTFDVRKGGLDAHRKLTITHVKV